MPGASETQPELLHQQGKRQEVGCLGKRPRVGYYVLSNRIRGNAVAYTNVLLAISERFLWLIYFYLRSVSIMVLTRLCVNEWLGNKEQNATAGCTRFFNSCVF